MFHRTRISLRRQLSLAATSRVSLPATPTTTIATLGEGFIAVTTAPVPLTDTPEEHGVAPR